MSEAVESVLVVRRSIHIKATPHKIWEEFTSFDRMNRWWGFTKGVPLAGSGNGQRLVTYEPRKGGHIEMEVVFDGEPLRYGGMITTFDAGRELTFDCDWIPNRGWLKPSKITIRLTAALDGTLVEILHHGFERTGPKGAAEHADYEGGWTMTQLTALRKFVTGA